MLSSTLKYLCSVEPVRMQFPSKQLSAAQHCTLQTKLCAVLHSSIAHNIVLHGCFEGKCILTDSTEQRYFKIDDSMEKNRDTVIPADLERLFVSGTYMSRWSRKG